MPSQAKPANPKAAKVTFYTSADINPDIIEQIRCRSCSGYGNCGWRQMIIYDKKPVSVCQQRKAKLAEEDGITLPF